MAAAQENGVRLSSGTTVLGVETASGRVCGVGTDDGIIEAPVVVNAAGSWAAQLLEPLPSHADFWFASMDFGRNPFYHCSGLKHFSG